MTQKPTEQAQDLYLRIQENKLKLKEEREYLKDEYQKIPEYRDLEVKARGINNDKKVIRYKVDQDNPDVVQRMADLKIDIASDKEMLDEIFTSALAKGEMLEIENQYQQLVIPIFSVALRPKE